MYQESSQSIGTSCTLKRGYNSQSEETMDTKDEEKTPQRKSSREGMRLKKQK